jgi:sedoheptulokinase
MIYIGIDVGTTTVCGLAYDTENRKADVITLKNNSGLHSKKEWEKIQDPAKLVSLVYDILESFSTRYGQIGGIGIAGQMHGILYTDNKGNAVSPLYTWEDNRGNQVYKGTLSYARFLSGCTGYRLASGYGLVTHFFNLKNGLVPKEAVKFCTVMDYLVMKLTGNTSPLIDPTNAASFGLFDLANLVFDHSALTSAVIPPDMLPEIKPSGTLAGFYKGGIPVYSAIGDNQASFLGSAANINNSILVNIGTGSQISVYSEELVYGESVDVRPFPGGGYLLVGAALYGGKSLALLKSFFEKTIGLFVPGFTGEITFYEMLNSVSRAALSDQNTLQVNPMFNGSRKDPEERGIISNISDTNFTPEGFMAGFLIGICNEMVDFYNEMPVQKQGENRYLAGSGNAVRKNPVMQKMLEISFERKLLIPVYLEESAFGACICALAGGKQISGLHEAGSLIEYISH